MKFNWKKFKKGKLVVHCRTKKQEKDFLKRARKHGLDFYSGKSSKEKTHYGPYKKQTCYRCSSSGGLSYADFDFYIDRFKIVEWSDYLKE